MDLQIWTRAAVLTLAPTEEPGAVGCEIVQRVSDRFAFEEPR
jgi:hypothetical protein